MNKPDATVPSFDGFNQEDWDEVSDNPELTAAELASLRSAAEVLPPALYAALEWGSAAMQAGRPYQIEITDEEEGAIQAGVALDPDNPELTDEELASLRPAGEVLPPKLYAALTRGSADKVESDA